MIVAAEGYTCAAFEVQFAAPPGVHACVPLCRSLPTRRDPAGHRDQQTLSTYYFRTKCSRVTSVLSLTTNAPPTLRPHSPNAYVLKGVRRAHLHQHPVSLSRHTSDGSVQQPDRVLPPGVLPARQLGGQHPLGRPGGRRRWRRGGLGAKEGDFALRGG